MATLTQVCACAVRTRALFRSEQPNFESLYWSSLSAVLARLDMTVEEEDLTEEWCAVLCQLTRLQRLMLFDGRPRINRLNDPALQGVLKLDLPRLERLRVMCIAVHSIHLICPKLVELELGDVYLESISGMPGSLQKVDLALDRDTVPLQDILTPESARCLEELTVWQNGQPFTDAEALKALCLNGKLRCLRLDYPTFHAGAFSVGAVWQAVPQTLQELTLTLPLNEGIPRILESFLSLTMLSLGHSETSLMHLDRPLDPFLEMPRLEKLELYSSWDAKEKPGADMCMWTPPALRYLGLAEKRIMQMQIKSPGRSITLVY